MRQLSASDTELQQRSAFSSQLSAEDGRSRCVKPTADSRKLTARGAFSLIEVVLALAVIAIGLLAVIGLFPQGLQSARDAADNTLSATIVQDLFSQLRNSTAGSLSICDNPIPYGSPGYPGCNHSLPVSLSGSTTTFYFDQEGFITPSPSYFTVTLTCTLSSLPNLSTVAATVRWPPGAPAKDVFVTEVAWNP